MVSNQGSGLEDRFKSWTLWDTNWNPDMLPPVICSCCTVLTSVHGTLSNAPHRTGPFSAELRVNMGQQQRKPVACLSLNPSPLEWFLLRPLPFLKIPYLCNKSSKVCEASRRLSSGKHWATFGTEIKPPRATERQNTLHGPGGIGGLVQEKAAR